MSTDTQSAPRPSRPSRDPSASTAGSPALALLGLYLAGIALGAGAVRARPASP